MDLATDYGHIQYTCILRDMYVLRSQRHSKKYIIGIIAFTFDLAMIC